MGVVEVGDRWVKNEKCLKTCKSVLFYGVILGINHDI